MYEPGRRAPPLPLPMLMLPPRPPCGWWVVGVWAQVLKNSISIVDSKRARLIACLLACVYACMHACMHTCLLACMHACKQECMHAARQTHVISLLFQCF